MSVAVQQSVIRRSLAEGLLSCPQFKREDNERLAFGIAIHHFVASYWRHLQAVREESDLTAVAALAADAWSRTPGLLRSRYDEFTGLCQRFAETHLGDLDTLYSVEETLTQDVGFALLTCTSDRVDRIDGGDRDDDPTHLRIWDAKSEVAPMDHYFQARWYTKVRFDSMPSVEYIDFVIDPLRRGEPNDPIPFERGELDQWWDTEMAGLRLNLLSPNAPPTGGPACNDCALRRTCAQATAEARAIPDTEEEADALLSDFHRHAAAAEVCWEAMQPFYRERAPREVNGEEIGFLRPRDPAVVVTIGPREMRFWNALCGRDQDAYLKVATPTNRGVTDLMILLGLAEMRLGPEQFKTRKPEPESKRRRRAKMAEEAAQ